MAFLTRRVRIPHPHSGAHPTMLYLFQTKNTLVRQQHIYHVFSHASKLPHLPSSPSPEKYFTHLTNFYPTIYFHTENRNIFEDHKVFCKKLIIFYVKDFLVLQRYSDISSPGVRNSNVSKTISLDPCAQFYSSWYCHKY